MAKYLLLLSLLLVSASETFSMGLFKRTIQSQKNQSNYLTQFLNQRMYCTNQPQSTYETLKRYLLKSAPWLIFPVGTFIGYKFFNTNNKSKQTLQKPNPRKTYNPPCC